MLAILILLLIIFVPIAYIFHVIYGIQTLQKPISETTPDERYDAWTSIIAVVGGILFTMWLMS